MITGLLAISAPFFEGGAAGRRGDLLLALFLLILGGLLLYNLLTGVVVLQFVAWTLLVFGALLTGVGFVMRPRWKQHIGVSDGEKRNRVSWRLGFSGSHPLY